MNQMKFDRTENNATLIQIHSCSVTLWNIAVAMKTGGQTEAVNNAKCKILSRLIFASLISNGNRTEWSPIRSVIVRVITKPNGRTAGVRFVYQEYDYRPNWTTRSPIIN